MPKTIICLVSKQAMANIIPVLELSPDKVILLRTYNESSTAENIYKLLSSRSIDVHIHENFIDPYDYLKIKEECENIINSNSDLELILNATGGTKIMSIAAIEIFRKYEKTIIYNEMENSEIRFLYPDLPSKKFQKSISVRDYLLAHGYVILEDLKNSGRAEAKSEFFKYLSKERLLTFISFYSELKSKGLLTPSYYKNKNKLNPYKNYGFVFEYKKDKFTISDVQSKNFFESTLQNFNLGDWLEDLLFLILKESKPYDISYGVKIKNTKTNVENEIDVILTKQYRLFLYSCKDNKNLTKDALYELDVLKLLVGGTFGYATLVYTKDNENIINIANLLNIKTQKITDLI